MPILTNAEKASYDTHIANTGDPHNVTKTQVGLSNCDNTSDADKPLSTASIAALAGKEPANANIQAHISSTNDPHSVTKAQVGLGNCDNTSDVDKPVSTAQQTEIDTKEDSLNNPASNGDMLTSTTLGVRSWVTPIANHNELADRTVVDCHSIGAITGLADALDGKESGLGVPVADGYVLKSLTNGTRYWELVASGAADWGSIGGDINTQLDLQAELDLKADLVSPDLTGTPTAPTQVESTNSTAIATTAYVDRVASGGGVVEFSASATENAGDGTIEGDVNNTDWTGNPHASGTSLEILTNEVVTFNNYKGIAYRWVGPKPVLLGIGGNHVSVETDYVPTGTNDHTILINTELADQHPTVAITGLDDALAGKAPIVHQHAWSDITSGVPDFVVSDVTTELGSDRILNMVSLTQAEYDALTPNAQTLYFIVG